MTTRRPLVVIAGAVKELPSGDDVATGGLIPCSPSNTVQPAWETMGGVANAGTSQRGYWLYMGTVREAFVANYVAAGLTINGAGAVIVEVGLFSTPSAPNGAGQTLTKIISGLTATSTSGSPRVLKNSSAFNTTVTVGTHLWTGYRTEDNGGTKPTLAQAQGDGGRGGALFLNSATAFSAASTWSGGLVWGVLAFPNDGQFLWIEK